MIEHLSALSFPAVPRGPAPQNPWGRVAKFQQQKIQRKNLKKNFDPKKNA